MIGVFNTRMGKGIMEDAVHSINSLLVNAGVIGTIALVLIIGGGYMLFIFGGKLCKIASDFVAGTLEHMGKMVEQMNSHGTVMKEISETQKEIQKTQSRLADRVEDLHKKH